MRPDAEAAETLAAIGRRHGCDKFTVHRFEDVYAGLLGHRRTEPLRVLEIGIGEEDRALGGASLLTWSEFLPEALIVGIDLYDKRALDTERIVTRACDQGDPTQLAEVVRELGPFDLVIDDGSHHGHDVATSMFALLGAVRPGGSYVLEDLQTSYWPEYGGSSVAPYAFDTAVRWLRLVIDVVNRSEIPNQDYFPLGSGWDVESLHVFHNIAVLRVPEVSSRRASAVLDDARRLATLDRDRNENGHRADVHQLLASSPNALGRLLDLLSNLDSKSLREDLHDLLSGASH